MWFVREAITNPRLEVDMEAHVGGGLCGFVFGSALSFLRMPTKRDIALMLSVLYYPLAALMPLIVLVLQGLVLQWLVTTHPLSASTFLQHVRHRSRTWGHRVSKRATRALKAKPLASCGLLLVGLLLLLAHALLPAAVESTCGQAGYTSVRSGIALARCRL